MDDVMDSKWMMRRRSKEVEDRCGGPGKLPMDNEKGDYDGQHKLSDGRKHWITIL